MSLHFLFDLMAYSLTGIVSFYFRNIINEYSVNPVSQSIAPYYSFTLLLGLISGSILFGTLNVNLSDIPGMGKSVLGGLAGGIIVAETFKWITGIKGSTGIIYVPGLAIGIAVGRMGCYLSGLEDYTYGIETSFFLGTDFGDGISRHPVQLYESITMFSFLLIFIISFQRMRSIWLYHGFYIFILFYAFQRFVWEFLKPYPVLWQSLNLFHFLCIGLIAYALIMLLKNNHAQ